MLKMAIGIGLFAVFALSLCPFSSGAPYAIDPFQVSDTVTTKNAGLVSHPPIFIDGNDGFKIGFNGVTGGNGSISNPWTISGWDVNASAVHGIWISNTSDYFIIRDCFVHDGKFGGMAYYGIYFDNVTLGYIKLCNLTKNYDGIHFENSMDNGFSFNNITQNYNGIFLHGSNRNMCWHNKVFQNDWHGIVHTCTGANYISYNDIDSNAQTGVSLACAGSHIITSNNITGNMVGIIAGGALNIIKYNNISNNKKEGILVEGYRGNKIIYNNITCNIGFGVNISSINFTTVVYNNFKFNNGATNVYNPSHIQARDDSANFWNFSYPNGGNYWSDWTSPDVNSGPNQDMPGSDGIVDSPYLIDGSVGAKDYYPLTAKVVVPEPSIAPIIIISVLLITALLVRRPRRRICLKKCSFTLLQIDVGIL